MKKIFDYIKKYKKDFLIVLGVLFLGIMAVMGTHFSDAANTKFWWTFWAVLNVVGIVGWVAAWLWAVKKDKKQ